MLNKGNTMQNVLELEGTTQIQQNNSYIISYPHILSYFQELDEIKVKDVVRGAHMIYGWMPTVLDLYPEPPNKNLHYIAELLTKARNGEELTEQDIAEIAAVVNNSLVGASKLLHFIAPQDYAIWDSKIYKFIHQEKAHNYRVNNIKLYKEFLNDLKEIKIKPNFSVFHNNVNEKMGYKVSAMRAIEAIMFLNAPTSIS